MYYTKETRKNTKKKIVFAWKGGLDYARE